MSQDSTKAKKRSAPEEEEEEFKYEELEEFKDLPSVTRDGHQVLLWVNIGLIGDISRSLHRGAEGPASASLAAAVVLCFRGRCSRRR